ncbi:MAG: nitronate monooxygenase [Verrucomicrobia bacterium]|nr:nitronate monooxygenase [Verrucomicrobiota bacterium]
MSHPVIIQGGMGVAVSNWQLARVVSRLGSLGVVSGTALASVLARRLEAGDPGGDMRRALAHFPIPAMAERVLARFYVPDGKAASAPFTLTPMPSLQPGAALTELTVTANFVEVFLAKAGHNGLVGINLLEKIQLPTLASLYGAMLAGVDYVLMGAGIPRAIPGAMDQLAAGGAAEQKLDVAGAAPGQDFFSRFDPSAFFDGAAPKLSRPFFLAIVASATLAMTLAKKSTGRVDGFVVEGELAGGHNAPPRGTMTLDARGEPIYGPRDVPDLGKIRELGLPFWLAGSQARPERLAEARSVGATGIQVGTAFAFCDESGIDPALKRRVIAASRAGQARVFTDPAASPTGFPFKVAEMPGTVSDAAIYATRERVCDLGYLRELYITADGHLGYRCAGEPVEAYMRKGGNRSETVGRKCLCNGLMATAGLGQVRPTGPEPALLTAGNEVADLARLVHPDADHYSAADVIHYLESSAAAAPLSA